ncbi:probable peroxisomal acyl-coenzyme A oxidase 1 [Drosophila sulfurigaster albostrigata]|uniref:probable peroxisomal acyl-coenzyme A oxidase 1 n=1 Tax=Drosophila sulfurigaster albostrigata TaxID=89887 RepID=UPI002D2194A9|nr:probable peroxisomal acyl-coenzyme A oxidase 1 [Drosophila sulfurigaster albostrigata]
MGGTESECNNDLQRERNAASIRSEDFAVWWAGGREALEQQRSLERFFLDDPQFEDAEHPSFMSYKERYEHAVAKGSKFVLKLRQWRQRTGQTTTAEDGEKELPDMQVLHDLRMLMSGSLGTALFQQSFPLRLHYSMFLSTLLNQGTAEQQQEWLSRAWRLDGVIGTYAQTELGHGSYIRGLETRADYDPKSQEFVLNTPTLSAYKWWPGGLGHTANMVVVLAQLYIRGKHHGLQPFLVRIRDEQTHEPMPGIDVGDIGAKLGANAVNNGFLGFRNVRIPRTQMLMKNAQVLADGTFVKATQPLLLYGTMVFVRVMIVRDVMFGLLQAATIATRYSAVRRQSPIEPHAAEPQILDHLTQQEKVLPQVARGVCYRLAADVLWTFYQRVTSQLASKQTEAAAGRQLAELHALSCSLKAVCTLDAAEGIDVLRKSCGGHGYLASANFDSIQGLANAAVTYEGEYTVLLLQTARFLQRQYVDGLKRRVLPPSVTYLRNATRLSWSNSNLLENVARALEISATEQVRDAWQWQQTQRKHGQHTQEQATNLAGRRLISAASLHGHVYLVRNSINQLKQLQSGQLKPELLEVLQQLIELFVLDTWQRQLGAVLKWNNISGRQLQQVEQRYEQLLQQLRPNAVAVVDGFDFHDRVLGSTLGCYDGRVYERLMEHARGNPLNQESVNRSYHTHLRPLMQAKL